jgi:hypothetical protein
MTSWLSIYDLNGLIQTPSNKNRWRTCWCAGERAQERIRLAGQAQSQRQPQEGGASRPRLPWQEALLHHQGQGKKTTPKSFRFCMKKKRLEK